MSNDTIDLDKALDAAPETAPNGRKLAKWEKAIEASRGRFNQIADASLVNYDRESLVGDGERGGHRADAQPCL
jgi:hypothetical protein